MSFKSRSADDTLVIPADIRLIGPIVEVMLHPIEYHKTEVENVIRGVKEAAGDNDLLVLVEADDASLVTIDGVRALFTQNALSYARAKAYVLRNPFHFKIAQLSMMIFNPSTPLRFFRDRDEARVWLMEKVAISNL
jgi:hypothetical protein